MLDSWMIDTTNKLESMEDQLDAIQRTQKAQSRLLVWISTRIGSPDDQQIRGLTDALAVSIDELEALARQYSRSEPIPKEV